MPHKHQLQSDGPDQLSSSCSPAGKQCFFVEKPYKKLIRKNNLLNSKKVAFKTILQRLQRCWKVTSSVGWEDDVGERQWLSSAAHFPSALNETRFRRPISIPVKRNSAKRSVLQQYLRSKVVGWNNALSHTAETNGPMMLIALQVSQTNPGESKSKSRSSGSAWQDQDNCHQTYKLFFLFSRKSRRLFCRWTLQRKCLRSPIIVVGSLPSCTFHHGFFLAWLKHRVPKRPIWSCHDVMFSIHFASIFRAAIILNHNNVVISAKARVFLRLKISSL